MFLKFRILSSQWRILALPTLKNYHQKINNFYQKRFSSQTMTKTDAGYGKIPLIVIIGATGCGKTKLSVELARRCGGEVISADSMQIYKGLDIATAKATAEEQAEVPHHLLDEVDPFKQFTVLDFQRLAMTAIDDILARNKIPVIVGGTNYYIESVLWDTLVGSADDTAAEGMNIIVEKTFTKEHESENDVVEQEGDHSDSSASLVEMTLEELMSIPISYRRLNGVPSETLHRFLTKVDSVSASSLHPQNRRKIIRCLQVYQKTGRCWSDILAEQRSSGSRHGGPLRFANAIIFWVDCERSALETRLDKRVDEMMKLGLVEELQTFHRDYNHLRLLQNKKADYTEGIFQAIGLKEFHKYLLMDEEAKSSYEGSLALGNGILLLKQRTKGYVTRQLKWIQRRFLVPESVRQVPAVYRLDTTFPERWKEDVFEKAIAVIEAVRTKDDEASKQLLIQLREPVNHDAAHDDTFISGQFYCDLCEVAVSGGKSYQMHLKSKGHRAKAQAAQKTVQKQAIV